MKNSIRLFISIILIFTLYANVLPCGPSVISPMFDHKTAPENPYESFAAGKIGILKPTYHRSVLYAAYRYLNGGSFSANEQKALIDVWNADFKNKSFEDNDVGEAVKKWVETRLEVAEKDEKLPEIYTERNYGGYDFFPNCTKNAFETAEETLSSRIASYGSDSKDVKDWAKAQDQVFQNCASGKTPPEPPNQTMPEWLQKDRAYQVAAAEFYSLDYEDAKRRFAEIAQDTNSAWQETAEYLVGRTLIRQASLAKDETKANLYYIEAEQNLQNVAYKGGKYADSAERLVGLVKYRLRPAERVRELAQRLAYQSGGENFRQELIDYTWLLDKFEKEILEKEEKRKAEAERNSSNSNSDSNFSMSNTQNSDEGNEQTSDNLRISIYTEDYAQNWTFYVKPDATDEEAIAEAEKVVGRPLTDKMKAQVRVDRQSAYSARFIEKRKADYQGGYYGEEQLSRSIMPDFLRADNLTDWLFTFQMHNNEAYLYALSRFRQNGGELWLATAISKADENSTDLRYLQESAEKTSRFSVAYPTIIYHQARILLQQGKKPEARKLLDEVLNSPQDLPVSSVNQFLELRQQLAETLDDFLKFAQRKPFAFNWDGQTGTFEEFIAEQKSWYSPENYPDQTREEYEREVEERFKNERPWENRVMFDYDTINVINQHFPLTVLLEAEKSTVLPDYLRENFAVAIWTRAVLLKDFATAQKIAPQVLKYHPEFEDLMNRFLAAKTPLAKQNASFYLILKNPVLSPFLESSLDKSDNEFGGFDINDWWCEPYDFIYDEQTGEEKPASSIHKPNFLTTVQSAAAQTERNKIKALGDAPKFFGEKTIEWQKRSPLDKRVPESLYIAFQANGWTKYGCGNNIELRGKISEILRRRYPNNVWTQKIIDEEAEQ